jgi:hypothetical protein
MAAPSESLYKVGDYVIYYSWYSLGYTKGRILARKYKEGTVLFDRYKLGLTYRGWIYLIETNRGLQEIKEYRLWKQFEK